MFYTDSFFVDLLLVMPIGGIALLAIASFAWAKRRRDDLWYAFCAGFLLLFLSRFLTFIKMLSDKGVAYLNTDTSLLYYQMFSLVGNIGIWISAVALLIIALREKK